jgi:hypothetical protein
MKFQTLVLPALALGAAALLIGPSPSSYGFVKTGDVLLIGQRDFRVRNNFADRTANNNIIPNAQFPGALGPELAFWKSVAEWGSGIHGDGSGDPLQPNIGDGGANFDGFWAGRATNIGSTDRNIISAVTGCVPGLVAFTEAPTTDGWRIRFCENLILADGPGDPAGVQYDLQGVGAHEYGHALGLNHSVVPGATMIASTFGGPASAQLRSIEADDIAGVQCIYGVKAVGKPEITAVSVGMGQLVITGLNFDLADNTVWFTNAAATAGSTAPVVEVSGVASIGGTQIQVAIPAGAGPGEVAVRIPGGALGNGLSNVFPTDLGLEPIPLATAVSRNGSGVNPVCLSSLTPPALGTDWQVQVDAAGHPGAVLTGLRCHVFPHPGILTPLGELLIDLSSSRCFALTQAASGGADVYVIAAPRDARLVGLTTSVQAFILGGAGPELCNALDVTLGI